MITLCLLGVIVLLIYMLWVAENSLTQAETKIEEVRNRLKVLSGCYQARESYLTELKDSLTAESIDIDEQCRLNAMGQERELKLMTRIQELERKIKPEKKRRARKSAGRRVKP